ncbi:MAG: DUF2207 domain-containing protein [Actinobacteria bacterium]|nr:DUF2207 domain-containing protein [Actinomycetota bacterium]
MQGGVRWWRHVIVGLAIVVMAVLAGIRLIGAGDDALLRPEHFDAKQVTVWPAGIDEGGGEGVRIREVVDIDFGINERHGYQREIPNDFGVPTLVMAASPDANDELDVFDDGYDTRIRVGNPGITFMGRHRYVVEYTLPDANLSSGQLTLDIIGTGEPLETDRFEVVLTGFDFSETSCDTGSQGDVGGCELTKNEAGNWVTVIEPLEEGDGITVGGAITSLTAPEIPPEPAPPAPLPTGFQPLGYLLFVLGLGAAAGVFFWGRWYGSNEVMAGGAADAAFGDLPVPQSGEQSPSVPTSRVTDSRLAEMSTIEFVPPRGLEPWQGAMLLSEEVNDSTVSAWFSGMVATEALVVSKEGDDIELTRGPDTAQLNTIDQGHVERLFGATDTVELGKYDKSFTATWSTIKAGQLEFAGDSGWWSQGGPGLKAGMPSLVGGALLLLIVLAGIGLFVAGSFGMMIGSFFASPWVAVALGLLVPFLVALGAYGVMFPSRTATGSALTLRTESFRRFLAASEGRHVDWAWEHGRLREYSAWAVALDTARAWSSAIEASNVPHPEIELAGPLLFYSASSALRSTHTAPSSSGGGGGGGGGGVGGGGGGGSSGSW